MVAIDMITSIFKTGLKICKWCSRQISRLACRQVAWLHHSQTRRNNIRFVTYQNTAQQLKVWHAFYASTPRRFMSQMIYLWCTLWHMLTTPTGCISTVLPKPWTSCRAKTSNRKVYFLWTCQCSRYRVAQSRDSRLRSGSMFDKASPWPYSFHRVSTPHWGVTMSVHHTQRHSLTMRGLLTQPYFNARQITALSSCEHLWWCVHEAKTLRQWLVSCQPIPPFPLSEHPSEHERLPTPIRRQVKSFLFAINLVVQPNIKYSSAKESAWASRASKSPCAFGVRVYEAYIKVAAQSCIIPVLESYMKSFNRWN